MRNKSSVYGYGLLHLDQRPIMGIFVQQKFVLDRLIITIGNDHRYRDELKNEPCGSSCVDY